MMKEGTGLHFRKSLTAQIVLWIGITFLLAVTITYLTNEISRLNRTNREKQAVSNKVTLVMNLYHCDDPKIHTAILKTFDPVLIAIVIGLESEYRVDAVSPAGCRGLMQLTPDKLTDWRNIDKNIKTGAAYLETQLNRFGSLELAMAAYNAGPESVSRYQGVPPFPETREYVKKAKLLSLAFDHFLPWTIEPRHLL